MKYRVFAAMDQVQGWLGRAGSRFRWPSWLINRAWSMQAAPHVTREQANRWRLAPADDETEGGSGG